MPHQRDDTNTSKDISIGHQYVEIATEEHCNVEDDFDKSSKQIGRVDHCNESTHSESSDEVQVVDVSGPGPMTFSPLTFEAKVDLCSAFGCEVSNLKPNMVNVQCKAMGKMVTQTFFSKKHHNKQTNEQISAKKTEFSFKRSLQFLMLCSGA